MKTGTSFTAKDEKTLEALIASNNPNAEAVKAALDKHKEEQKALTVQRMLNTLRSVDRVLDANVSRLRDLRKLENQQKAKVLALNAAKEAFMKDGDLEALEKTIESLSF